MERLVLDSQAAKHVQAYIDYQNIVGMDDGGQMMSEKEFEAYKLQVREKRKNRLYVNWRSSQDVDCKSMGPASQCFCGHRFKEHFFDNIESREVYCRANKNGKKCKCKLFDYIPIFGSQDLKCLCKHSCTDHDPNGLRKCLAPNCKNCTGFSSKHHCNCGLTFNEHKTVFESREEREAEGRPVDPKWMQEGNMVGGMGGLVGDSHLSLAEGYEINDMRNPNAIVGNLNNGNMLMAPGMVKQLQNIGIDPKYDGIKALPQGSKQTGQQKMIAGSSSQGQVQLHGNEYNALHLFNTPHQFN